MKHDIRGSHERWNSLIAVTFFLLFALSLAVINRHVIAAANFELGDFAANSLLVQDAKSLSLLKGNYSRIGFNHPGPAILYVLALGELLFYNWTRIAPSPFAGQLIAVIIYSAFWITLIGVIFRRFSKSLLTTALLLTIFLMVSAASNYQFFAGAWFPHLYYFPFAALTVAVARIACGRGDSLVTLAISYGFLINGHVSFVPITAVMLAGALFANQVLFRIVKNPACINWLSWEQLYLNRKKLLVPLALVLVFFVPLCIETIVHFPGPVPGYVGYGAGNQGNGLLESLRFVSGYWIVGPLSVTSMWGVLLFGLVWVCARGEEYFADVWGLLTALLVASAGLVIYAKTGIDDLSQTYLGLFYYSVPAIGAATAAYCLYQKISFPRKAVAAVVIIGLGLRSTYMTLGQPPEYVAQYNQPGVPLLFQKMRTLGPSPLVLDLHDLSYLWSSVVGIQAYAKRMNVQLACINTNWHILFTEEGRCTESQVRTGNRFIVSKADPAGPRPSLEYLGLSFYRFELPLLSGKQVLAVRASRRLYGMLGKGWWGVEKDFVWSLGNEAELLVRIDPRTVKRIHLDLEAFLPRQESVQQVAVKLNDITVANLTFTRAANRGNRTVDVPENAGELITIKLLVSKPISPQETKVSNDPRKLGVALYGLGTE